MANEFRISMEGYNPEMKEMGIDILSSAGTPTASGPKKGALVIDTTNGKLYQNTGTASSATWNEVGGIAASEISLAEGNLLVGNNSGVGVALDIGATDKGFAIGNGTTATINALSGDITSSNTGVVTVSAGAVTNPKVIDSNGTGALAVPKSALVLYDFAVDGGVAGTIALTGSPTIPDNAVVWVDSYDVITTCTSASDAATIALQLPTDGALTTAIAISDASNPWDLGAFIGVQGGLASPLPKKTTAARVPSLVVAGGENITAGKIVFHLSYWISS